MHRITAVVFVLICIAAIAAYWLLSSGATPGHGSGGSRSATGSIGPYQFASDDELGTFNSTATQWFTDHGLRSDTSVTFVELVREGKDTGDEEWEKQRFSSLPAPWFCRSHLRLHPGMLSSRNSRTENRIPHRLAWYV